MIFTENDFVFVISPERDLGFLLEDNVAHLDPKISIDPAEVPSATQELPPAPPTETQSFSLSFFFF